MYEIVDHAIDAAAVTAAVAHPGTGATVTFIGTTRDHNDGRQVTRLEYEAYPEMVIAEMRKIAETARQRWPIERVAIVHRIGVVPIGDASVVIAVSAGHRRAAFEACHFAIDRLKEVVPIWKKEHFDGGEVWIGSQTGQRFARAAVPVLGEPAAPAYRARKFAELPLAENDRGALQEFAAQAREALGTQLVAIKLFGSKARGAGEAHSDIDVLVEVETATVAIEDAILDIAFDINVARDVYISPRVIDRSAFADPVRCATPFIRNLEQEGVTL